MTDFDGERFMIKVRLLAACNNLVHDNRMDNCDVTVCQTPHVFSDSPGIYRAVSKFLKIFNFESTENDPKNVDQVLRLNMNGKRESFFVVIWGFRNSSKLHPCLTS